MGLNPNWYPSTLLGILLFLQQTASDQLNCIHGSDAWQQEGHLLSLPTKQTTLLLPELCRHTHFNTELSDAKAYAGDAAGTNQS